MDSSIKGLHVSWRRKPSPEGDKYAIFRLFFLNAGRCLVAPPTSLFK
jgi:hypothetical protein